jgi:hypothetical protein
MKNSTRHSSPKMTGEKRALIYHKFLHPVLKKVKHYSKKEDIILKIVIFLLVFFVNDRIHEFLLYILSRY